MTNDSDLEGLRAGILRVVAYNTGGPRPEMVPEYGIVENRTRTGTDSGTVRDVLATLVAEGALECEPRDSEAYPRRP